MLFYIEKIYNGKRSGGILVKVKPYYTNQNCSSCGNVV
ncbi:MAG: zinc ribbon domain-containing protein [Bacillota bacterium]